MYEKTESGKYVVADQREALRVKVKSLAAEARIIRHAEDKEKNKFHKLRKTHEASKINTQIREDLYLHRVMIVRKAARSVHLAYGFLRGRTLEQMERTSRTPPNWAEVKRLCKKYGPRGFNGPPIPEYQNS